MCNFEELDAIGGAANQLLVMGDCGADELIVAGALFLLAIAFLAGIVGLDRKKQAECFQI